MKLKKMGLLPAIVFCSCLMIQGCSRPEDETSTFSIPGEAVGGVKIELACAAPQVKAGEDIALTIKVSNNSQEILDNEINLVKFSPANRFFYALYCSYNNEPQQRIFSSETEQEYGTEKIKRGASVSYSAAINGSSYFAVAENVNQMVESFFGRPGSYTFNLEYSFHKKSAISVFGQRVFEKKYQDFWQGTVSSNDITVTVTE